MSRRARPNDVIVSTAIGNPPTIDEARLQIDQILNDRPDLEPRGIEISNSIEQLGFEQEHRGLPVAMAEDLYPEPAVRVLFNPPPADLEGEST